MLPTEISVKNFRSLRDLTVRLSPTTVIIGENNAGKSALLDAIRLALSHRWGTAGTGFREYDFHFSGENDDPKVSPPVLIDTLFAETVVGEWPDDIVQEVSKSINIDIATNLQHIRMQTAFQYDAIEKKFVSTWAFLDNEGRAKIPASSRTSNIHVTNVVKFSPVFSLAALRDAAGEFGAHSQFWRKLIQSIQISESDWEELAEQLTSLNEQILSKDEKFQGIKERLEELKKIFPPNSVDAVELRALPLRIWDLIAKTELLVRATSSDPWLPLANFGQGVQSVAVLNVFRAYVDHLLAEVFEKESEPVLLMEEPEAHLHPQATRALYELIREIPGMKVVTTHSAHFLQNVPFLDIRLLRKVDGETKVFQIETGVSVPHPDSDALQRIVKKASGTLQYDAQRGVLSASRPIHEKVYRELLVLDKGDTKLQAQIKALRAKSDALIDGELLDDLEDQAKRLRGEIFFARKWLLIEGPSEYVIVRAAARAMGLDLDQLGIAVIDAKHHGSFGGFASLARAFGFPWAMIVDDDQGGHDAVNNVRNQKFDAGFLDACVYIEKDMDLEGALAESMDEATRRDLCSRLDDDGALGSDPGAVADKMRENKMRSAFAIRDMFSEGTYSEREVPEHLKRSIKFLVESDRYK